VHSAARRAWPPGWFNRAVQRGEPSRIATPAFAVLVAATAAVFTSFGAVVLALPLYVRDELGGSDLAVGSAIGAASIGAIVAGPVAGRIADRRGRRIVLVVSAAAMALGYLVLALEPGLSVVLPLRVVVGAAESGFVVAGYTMAADLAPTCRQGEAISVITAGSYCGLAIGPILAEVVVEGAGYPLAWLLATALVVAAGAAAVVLPETRPDGEEEAPRGFLPPRSALLPGIVLLLALIGFGGFNAFAALHAREVGLERPGLVFLVFAGVVIAVRVVGRTLPDRLGPLTAASVACTAIAGGLAVVALWAAPAGLLLGAAIFAAGQAFAYPAIALLATARATPVERSAALGAVIAFVDVALASGAFVLGVAAEAWGYRAVFVAGAASALAGLALLARTRAAVGRRT
jgi:predicted MFS family arabinose efflux permease